MLEDSLEIMTPLCLLAEFDPIDYETASKESKRRKTMALEMQSIGEKTDLGFGGSATRS